MKVKVKFSLKPIADIEAIKEYNFPDSFTDHEVEIQIDILFLAWQKKYIKNAWAIIEGVDCPACEGTGKSIYFLKNYMENGYMPKEHNIALLKAKNRPIECPHCKSSGIANFEND